MSWFKIDDQSAFHPKVLDCGNEAWGAFCRMGAHCSAHLTDGFLTASVASSIAPPRIIKQLINSRLLDICEGGFFLHDYHDYNPTREAELSKRQARAAAGRQGGLVSSQSKEQAKRQAIARANGYQNSTPSPSPSPNPISNPLNPPENTGAADGYLPPLAQDLEGFTDDPWTPGPTRKPNPPHSRNETQAQSASAEGLKVCGAAAKVDPRQQEIEAFLAEYPHCREVLESRRGDARTSVVGFFLAIVQGWIADPDSIPAKPVPVPRKRTPEELKAIRAQRDKEADDRFWDEREKQTGTPRAELIAEADRLIRERASGGGSENFGWLDKLAPKSVAAGMVN